MVLFNIKKKGQILPPSSPLSPLVPYWVKYLTCETTKQIYPEMGSSRFLRENLCSILLFVSLTAHIVHSPFTKVEESFNLQAIHDILFHSWDLKQYDHLEFPGVVPRTFIGAILVAIVSFPGNCMLYHFSFPKLWSQYLCRMIIGVVAAHSLHLFQSAISRKLGPRSGKLFLLLVSCQFHFPFYMTRTLPNTFATIACIYAYSNWLQVSFLLLCFYWINPSRRINMSMRWLSLHAQ